MRVALLVALSLRHADVVEIHPGTRGIVADYIVGATERGDDPEDIIDMCAPFIYEQRDRLPRERAAFAEAKAMFEEPVEVPMPEPLVGDDGQAHFPWAEAVA